MAKKKTAKKAKAATKKQVPQKAKAHSARKAPAAHAGRGRTPPKAKASAARATRQKPVPKAGKAQTGAKAQPLQSRQSGQQPAQKRKPRCIVLAGFGLNAEAELAEAFRMAGADPEIVHFSDISSGKVKLQDFEIFAIPGGWSFGDDIAGGRVLANKLKSTFRRDFEAFAESGKPIIGICNGFQTLVKLGALPNISGSFAQEATLTFNKSGKFEDRWIYMEPQKSACKYFEGVDFIHCPVRHGEGQFVPRDSALLSSLQKHGMIALSYTDAQMKAAPGYPANPNGSPLDIAGICDRTGKILGMMPHPECSMRKITFPRFTSGISYEKNSLRFFQNIVKAAEEYV